MLQSPCVHFTRDVSTRVRCAHALRGSSLRIESNRCLHHMANFRLPPLFRLGHCFVIRRTPRSVTAGASTAHCAPPQLEICFTPFEVFATRIDTCSDRQSTSRPRWRVHSVIPIVVPYTTSHDTTSLQSRVAPPDVPSRSRTAGVETEDSTHGGPAAMTYLGHSYLGPVLLRPVLKGQKVSQSY